MRQPLRRRCPRRPTSCAGTRCRCPTTPTDFVDGPRHHGRQRRSAPRWRAARIHVYAANRSMTDRYFYDADGELLIVPQQGRLRLATELGRLDVEPLEIVRDPARHALPGRAARRRRARLRLRELRRALSACPTSGVIGSNGLANPRDFLAPVAAYEDREGTFELVAKFHGQPVVRARSTTRRSTSSPGTATTRRTSTTCARFNAIGSISFDHPDPSIFLVLQSPSDTPGVDTIDFVIFPPRILAMEHTFRPPWFHRNVASEFMGLIHGVYDAKAEGFLPGGASLHNCMTRPRAGRRDLREGEPPPTCRSRRASATRWRSCSRRARVIRPTRSALESAQLQARVLPVLAGAEEEFRRRAALSADAGAGSGRSPVAMGAAMARAVVPASAVLPARPGISAAGTARLTNRIRCQRDADRRALLRRAADARARLRSAAPAHAAPRARNAPDARPPRRIRRRRRR